MKGVKILNAILISAMMLIHCEVSAEIRTVEADGEYIVGDGVEENFSVAREQAKQSALRHASEQAGVFVESVLKVEDMKLTKEEVTTISANVLQIQSEEFTPTVMSNKAIIIHCHLIAVVDDDNILTAILEKQSNLNDTIRRNQELEEENSRLTAELNQLRNELSYSTNIKNPYNYRNNSRIPANNSTDYSDDFIMGNKYFAQQNYQAAIQKYSNAIAKDPRFTLAYYNRGISYYFAGNYYRAILDYSDAIYLDPKMTDAYYNRALVYAVQGKYESAIDDANWTLRLEPDYSSAYLVRGLSYQGLGKYEQSISDFTTAIRLNPNEASAYNNRGISYEKIGEYELAANDFEHALELDPSNQIAKDNLEMLSDKIFKRYEYNQMYYNW